MLDVLAIGETVIDFTPIGTSPGIPSMKHSREEPLAICWRKRRSWARKQR